ncbi:MAG TPA: hypothetical protein VLX92_05315 [Kofleriaceae bacterium]|nr:hypothetical protein [Kofleriaceae bacterium]
MRSLLVGSVLVLCAQASADPLWDAEVRLGYGVAMGGGGGMTSTRASPLSIAALGSVAFDDDPHLSGYGGATFETLDRNSIGTLFGVKLQPHDSMLRFTGGGTWIFAPYTLWGATASAGACHHKAGGGLGLCGDVLLTSYFAGTDLAPHHTVTQLQLTLGVVFDAL